MYLILSDLPALTILFFSLALPRKSYEASNSIFSKGSAVPSSFPIDIRLTWFHRSPRMHILQHSRKLLLVLINGKFASVFTYPASFSCKCLTTNFHPQCQKVLPLSGIRTELPDCKLWKYVLMTRMLLSTTKLCYKRVRTGDSFWADLDFFPDVFIQKSGCSMVL